MDFGEIFTNSLKYPISNPQMLLIVGVVVLIAGLNGVLPQLGVHNLSLSFILLIVSVLVYFILFGYSIIVIKRGIEVDDEIPAFDWVKNFVDGIKVFVISFVYMIIPLIIISILGVVSLGPALSRIFQVISDQMTAANVTTVTDAAVQAVPPELWSGFFSGLAVVSIVALILFIIFGIFSNIAICRFAKYEELGQAFKLGEIWSDIKEIGIIKIIVFLIVLCVFMAIISVISGFITLIPYIGAILSTLLCGSYMVLFGNRALGLLYSEI